MSKRSVAIPLVAVLATAASCALFASGDKDSAAPLERTTLRVGVGNPIDTAPLRIAVAAGKFKDAGLDVRLVDVGADEAVQKLAAGDIDITFASDVSLFRAAAGGTALQLQGEAYTAGSNTMALVTLPGSDYTVPTVKKAPKIAVNMPDDVGALAARSVLGTAGVDVGKIQFKQIPFDRMPAALRAAQQAAADPAVVREALPKFSDIDATTAALISLGSYPTSVNGVRLQRVADLMHNSGLLGDRLDVQALLPGTNGN